MGRFQLPSVSYYLVVSFLTNSVVSLQGEVVCGRGSGDGRGLATCYDSHLGDGKCDTGNNNEECSYDGGDCCACTCSDGAFYVCAESPFDCVDPDASCGSDDDGGPFRVDETDGGDDGDGILTDGGTVQPTTPPVHGCVETFLSDGYCNWTNNNEECDYDGGDCCACTCVDTEFYECGAGGYDCLDPALCTGASSTSAGNRVSTPAASSFDVTCVAMVGAVASVVALY